MNWTTIPAEQIADGIERQMVWGERVMVCRLRIAPRTVTAVHSHPHEQITIVEAGRAVFTVSGKQRIVSPGDVLHFPSACEHGATMLDEEVVLVDIFPRYGRTFSRRHRQAEVGSAAVTGCQVREGPTWGSNS